MMPLLILVSSYKSSRNSCCDLEHGRLVESEMRGDFLGMHIVGING